MLFSILCVFVLSFFLISVQADVVTETFPDYSNDISFYNTGNSTDNTTDIQKADAKLIDIVQVVLSWDMTTGLLNITYMVVGSISLNFENSSGLIGSIRYTMHLIRQYDCVIDNCEMDQIQFEARIEDGNISTSFTDLQANEISPLDYSITNHSISLSGIIQDDRAVNLLQRNSKGNYIYGFDSRMDFTGGSFESAEDEVSQDYTVGGNFSTSFSIGQGVAPVVIALIALAPLAKRKNKTIVIRIDC